MAPMKPDTITVRVVHETELDADSADLTVVIEGSAVFSGDEAFKKATELRALVAALKEVGIEENRVKLRSVEINSLSFAIVKSSSAKYVTLIRTVAVELLPAVLGTIASHKGAKLTRLNWNYGQLKATKRTLRRQSLSEALRQARLDAEDLQVDVLGIYQLTEETCGRDRNPEYIAGDSAMFFAEGKGMRARAEDIGFHLGNSTTVTVDLLAEFRVTPFQSTAAMSAASPVALPKPRET
jgi:hypothetical protein